MSTTLDIVIRLCEYTHINHLRVAAINGRKHNMKNNTALQSELSRVRELKRNAEATIELLRSDMEQGKIHLRVSEDKEFRQKLAEGVVETSPPANLDYDYYVDVVEGQIYKKEVNAWNPWSKTTAWRIVPVESVFPENYNFSPEIEDWTDADVWSEVKISFSDVARAYLASEDEALEPDGSLPEWVYVQKNDVIAFGFDSEFGNALESVELASKLRAIDFAFMSILDEITVEL